MTTHKVAIPIRCSPQDRALMSRLDERLAEASQRLDRGVVGSMVLRWAIREGLSQAGNDLSGCGKMRNTRISLHLTEKEKAQYQSEADRIGVPLSDLLRQAIFVGINRAGLVFASTRVSPE